MEQTQINKEFINDVFNTIEETGEDIKKQIGVLIGVARKKIDSQVNCAKFEAAYGLSVSKKEREKTMREVQEIRKELWKKALDKADGKTTDAYEIYCELCSFD